MGPALADNRPDYLASGTEWRTPPLWGIGLTPVVNAHMNFLHEKVRQASPGDRNALMTFLNSL